MSVLVVGLSHRSAPLALLERAALPTDAALKALRAFAEAPHLDEVVLVSTCNRIEVYADVTKFHGGISDVSEVLGNLTGLSHSELVPSLYVHYEDRAVQHLFHVACGLDSMVVGEAQILGQLRTAYAAAQVEGSAGRVLHELFQQALRVGKRAHTDTGIDRAGASLVSVGLDQGAPAVGGLAGKDVLLVGAGSMGALSGTTLRRAGARSVVVANRTKANAERLAAGLEGRGVGLDGLVDELALADVVVTSTGSVGVVVSVEAVAAAMARRPERPLFLLDLALPRDVDSEVRDLPGVTVVDLESLHSHLAEVDAGTEVEAARHIVLEEVGQFLSWQRSVRVAPTVVALRTKASEVVVAELARFDARTVGLDGATRREVETAVRRVVEKLLHAPTVRVKELAGGPDGEQYAEVIRELFDLGRTATEAVARADVVVDESLLDSVGDAVSVDEQLGEVWP